MRYKLYVAMFFLLIFSCTTNAGPHFGLGVGYVAKNIYTDNQGFDEKEQGVPLLVCGAGYDFAISIIEIDIATDMDFFGMDLIKGNRELTLFLKPHVIISLPLRFRKMTFSPLIGYGGLYTKRYINERTYLKGQDRYINSADYENTILDILFGGMVTYENWFTSSFFALEDPFLLHSFLLQIRTPKYNNKTPYINIGYTGGEKICTYSLGLTFYR